ncbi:MAG: TIGR00180 family glycosyltransferase [Sedimentisphaerales bacterium]|nr:TIGR00180 family glycosyltransferase [Sedimentisphaerales bacterium]
MMLTILLPTQNRSSFLRRALKFYEEEGLLYKIYVIDSSHPSCKSEVRKIVKSSNLNIELLDYEFGVSVHDKELKSLNLVESEYVLMIGDDDFIFPNTIVRCVEFLNNNKDYTAAHGRSYLFAVENAATYGRIKSIEVYPQAASVINSSEQRFKAHMRNWTTTAYSVQRTKNMREIIAVHRLFGDDIRFMELHWYATNVIRGKVAKLDRAYMFRQVSLRKEWDADAVSIWSETPEFSEKKKILIKELSNDLTIGNSRTLEHNRKICASELTRWIKDRRPLRPFTLKNILNHSVYYYLNKINEKMRMVRNKKIVADKLAIEKVRVFVGRTDSVT